MFLFVLLLGAALVLILRHRTRLAAGSLGVAVVAFPSTALAQDVPVNDDTIVGSITLSSLTVTLLISLFIPIATGILTKSTLAGYWKGLLTLILNGFNAALVQATVADGGAFFSRETLVTTLIGLAISVTSYLGIYRDAGLTSSATNGKLFPASGLG